ncbi:TetR family transcriptional regulator [Actinomadura sp. LD22]|uniref:TetR family transcriptional regulator n=1 Tax=Actinomadura physcomitrii TaxID=2650748 RepID=A0A6I4MF44_9ACTN|nr:TetR/AcrR family transcriptional regulator [Actinomadura physcomitrii]MWA00846.1 TetR family transcriptional regulator [Actinomadura physcomitrii]
MPVQGQAAERVRIIDAAYRCLAGAEGAPVSITEILTAAGLSTRAFYRHFESKDALFLAMFRRDGIRVMTELRSLTSTANSPAEALGALVNGMLHITADDRRRRRVLALSSGEATRARGYAEERARALAEQEELIVEILRAGQADGSFPWTDPEPDARSIRAVLGQAFEDQMTGAARDDAVTVAAQITGFALRALGAGRPAN